MRIIFLKSIYSEAKTIRFNCKIMIFSFFESFEINLKTPQESYQSFLLLSHDQEVASFHHALDRLWAYRHGYEYQKALFFLQAPELKPITFKYKSSIERY